MESMVSAGSIVCMGISVIISVGFPLFLAIFWRRRTGAKWVSLLLGMLVFFLFVYVLENALHQACIYGDNPVSRFLAATPWAYILYGGFAAGIFEETGRFLTFKYALRKQNGREASVMYGIGHGGFEALLIGGLAMVQNLLFSLQLNAVGADTLLSAAGDQADAISAAIVTLTTQPPVTFLAAGAERVIAICLHISLSVLVFLAAKRKGKWWLYPLAILFHAGVDCVALLFHVTGWITNIWLLELIVLAMTGAIAFFALGLYRKDGGDAPAEAAAPGGDGVL